MTTTTKTTAELAMETYKAARRDGKGCADACHATMAAHGIDAKAAADISWRAETGKPAPVWKTAGGEPTKAAMDWARGADRQHEED